ncbi:hypothetical protein BDW59DRAFT_180716 [Aspergillus cavernicola]|uniref:FAD-binding PCMH-type domain-containing protein n=1 Tax=Aspergillus cavernicola TaxID=176166 RepID=A0ABR4I6D3_9EURO
MADLIATLRSLLHLEEIITPDSPDYQANAQTWAAQKQLHPRVVVRPTSIESLSKVIAHLYSTDLDFAIYGHGFMSTSAQDVLVNMTAFDEFHFDKHSELVTVGAGQPWGEVYRKLAEVAPGYAVVGARTPSVGVGGTITSGGLSWISAEHGCISDPANMLDARVVKYDGSVVWASAEPDLLWALRGGGGGFGALAQVVLRVFPYPTEIWAGTILIPRDKLEQVADGLVELDSQPADPKITMLIYVVKKRVLESLGAEPDMLLIHVFDAHGETHGRETFRWALDIPGAVDRTKVTSLMGVVGLQDKVDAVKGSMKQFWAPFSIPVLSRETIIRAVRWSDGIQRLDESLGDCTYLILELFASRDPAGSVSDSAYPRPAGMKHLLILGTGCPSDAGLDKEKLAHDLAAQATSHILGKDEEPHYLPSGQEDFYDPQKIWGPHFPRLQSIRRRYDPRKRFKGAVSV